MDQSPQGLRELARYLHNTARLFPTPRTKKALKWLRIKAEEADHLAKVWEEDRKRFQALHRMYKEQTAKDESEIEELLAAYLAGDEGGAV